MSIADELREWSHGFNGPWKRNEEMLTAIADRIDAEHERQCAESWMRGHDAWAAIDRSDEMAEHGWVKLPVDADGVPIRVGDVLESEYESGTYVRKVMALILTDRWDYEMDDDDPEDGDSRCVADMSDFYRCTRHYHAPTVEDVLRKFAHVGIRIAAKHGIKAGEIDFYADEDAIAEYAAKLRLAGDE